MHRKTIIVATVLSLCGWLSAQQAVRLNELDINQIKQEYGTVTVRDSLVELYAKSIAKVKLDGKAERFVTQIRVGGEQVREHDPQVMVQPLVDGTKLLFREEAGSKRLVGIVGKDGKIADGSVRFIVKADGKRQFRSAYVEIPKKNGKSELAAAIALYLLYGDGEASAEVYGCANDRSQASIVFDVAKRMVEKCPALLKRSKIAAATKRIVNYRNAGFYQVLSAETGTKHGLNISGLVFDEIHAQPNRKLYDVMTKGSGDAREQPLFFIITTAGTDKESICYELHTKALDIMNGRKSDPSFYPVIYGLSDEDDWNDEKNWYKANPSLGYTISIDRVRDAYREALDNPAEENVFKQLRLNIWTNSAVAWIPEHIYDRGNQKIDYTSLLGRDCYAGLDLSSTSDITALVLVFPPRTDGEKYIVLPFFWLPEETLELRCRRDHVLYDVWERQGYILTTEGNVIHYGFIERFIEQLGEKYHIIEIAYDRWNATQMVQNLEDMGFTMVPFGQGFKDMSPPSKELYKLLMEGNIIHGGNPVLKWMAQNVVMRQDPAGNIKPDKEKSVEKIDGIVALIMGLDRCIRSSPPSSVYDTRGILFI